MKTFLRKAIYNTLTFLMGKEKLLFLLTNKVERILLSFKTANYLYDIGWTNSIIKNQIIDANDNPIPWATYPFIQFINGRLNKNLDVFEFGTGNSTLYYAQRVNSVNTVEHDFDWYNKMHNDIPANVTLHFCDFENKDAYEAFPLNSGRQYDIMIVDAKSRVKCCLKNLAALKPSGIIILDDTEREEYSPAVEFLMNKGFKKIDFWGTAPSVYYLKCTTIFYRTNNCLDI
jgi:hypothetical protein